MSPAAQASPLAERIYASSEWSTHYSGRGDRLIHKDVDIYVRAGNLVQYGNSEAGIRPFGISLYFVPHSDGWAFDPGKALLEMPGTVMAPTEIRVKRAGYGLACRTALGMPTFRKAQMGGISYSAAFARTCSFRSKRHHLTPPSHFEYHRFKARAGKSSCPPFASSGATAPSAYFDGSIIWFWSQEEARREGCERSEPACPLLADTGPS